MARPFNGEQSVASALAVLNASTTVQRMRQAQVVLVPLRYGLSVVQPGEVMARRRTEPAAV